MDGDHGVGGGRKSRYGGGGYNELGRRPDQRGGSSIPGISGRESSVESGRFGESEVICGAGKRIMSETADVVIIGGGVIGASIAFNLAKRGIREVIIVEKNFIASGATGKSSACIRQ